MMVRVIVAQFLIEAVDLGLMALVRHRDEFKTAEEMRVARKLADWFKKVDGYVVVGAGLKELWDHTTGLLKLGN
jgi:hypothetical protein